jgi:hypothetical protein
MKSYEAMVIVDARLDEGDIQKAVDRFAGAADFRRCDRGGRCAWRRGCGSER